MRGHAEADLPLFLRIIEWQVPDLTNLVLSRPRSIQLIFIEQLLCIRLQARSCRVKEVQSVFLLFVFFLPNLRPNRAPLLTSELPVLGVLPRPSFSPTYILFIV